MKVGLDYLGLMTVKDGNGDKKAWICLFICLTTCPVHLELVNDMSTVEFLMCFRWFIAQHGRPNETFSDNAKQFKAAGNILNNCDSTRRKYYEFCLRCSDKMVFFLMWNYPLARWLLREIGGVSQTLHAQNSWSKVVNCSSVTETDQRY